MSGIFINYRRDDSGEHAAKLFSQLRKQFDDQHIFIDVYRIEPGTRFTEEIETALTKCDFFLAVIGMNWLTITDKNGRPRIESASDLVRNEIEFALQNELEIIPILVDGASMPESEKLPNSLRGLTSFQAMTLQSKGLKKEVAQIVGRIDRIRRTRQSKREEIAAALMSIVEQKAQVLEFGDIRIRLSDEYLLGNLLTLPNDIAEKARELIAIGCTLSPMKGKKPYILIEATITWGIPHNPDDVRSIVDDAIDINNALGFKEIERIEVAIDKR